MIDSALTRRQALATVGTAVLCSCSGCTVLSTEGTQTVPTTQFRSGLQNRGHVDKSIPTTVEVEAQWAVPTNRGDHSASKGSPVQTATGRIVVADDTGRVRSLTPEGVIQWETTITDAQRGSHGTPAIANETIYIGAYDGMITALAVGSGDIQWQTDVGDAVGASPTYYDGRLYVAVEHDTPSGSVVAIDALTGEIEWEDERPTDHPHSTITIDQEHNRLLCGSNDGYCYAWSFPDLKRKWAYDTGGDVKAPIAVSDGIAIIPSWANTLTGVDVTDGSRRWVFEADDDIMCAPAVHNGTVYVGSHDTNCYAIDIDTGSEVWKTETGGWITGSAVATRDHVLVGSYDSQLYALTQADGSVSWTFEARGEVTGAPCVTAEAIYFTERAKDGERTQPGRCYRLVETARK